MDITNFLSKYSNHKKNIELIDKINRATVISFDIFDTLLTRSVLNPTDLFYFMNQDIKKIMKNERSLIFHKIRPKIEKITRQKASQEEITLDEIYLTLEKQLNLNNKISKKIKDLELYFEEKSLFPREYVKDIYDLCVSLNKRIIIISDMYLPEDFLKKVLEKNNYKNFEKIIVSSTYGLTKHSGNLYPIVLSKLSLEPHQMLHIGDNLKSDIKNAELYGIKTFFTPKAIDVAKESNEFIKNIPLSSYVDKAILSMIVNNLYSCPYNEEKITLLNGSYFNMGYVLFGSVLFGLTTDMIKQSKEKNLKHIIFFERDGYIPRKIFDKIKPFLDASDINSESLFINRNIVNIFAINNYPEILFRYDYKLAISNLIKEILPEKSEEEINSYLKNRGYKLDTDISDIDFNLINEILKDYNFDMNEVKSEILSYIEKIFYKKDMTEIGTFDIGYQGSTDMLLALIKPDYNKSFHFYLYFKTGSAYHNFKHSSYLETLSVFDITEICISNTLSQYNIAINNKLKMTAKNLRNINLDSLEIKKINDVQNGILTFIEDILQRYDYVLDQFQPSKPFSSYILSYLRNSEKKDILLLSHLDNGEIIQAKTTENKTLLLKDEIEKLNKTINSLNEEIKFNNVKLKIWAKNTEGKWKDFKYNKPQKISKKLVYNIYYKHILAKFVLKILQ